LLLLHIVVPKGCVYPGYKGLFALCSLSGWQ
jgi:hypothetical protein